MTEQSLHETHERQSKYLPTKLNNEIKLPLKFSNNKTGKILIH